MRKVLLLALLLVVAGTLAFAADAPARISKYVIVHHETIHGKYSTYKNLAREFKQAAMASNSDAYWLATENITGHGNVVTYVAFQDSLESLDNFLASIQKISMAAMTKNASMEAQSVETAGEYHDVLLKYREDISLNPTEVDSAHATRYKVVTWRLKPGYMTDVEEQLKQIIELRRKNNLPGHWIAYQVIGGVPGPAVVMVTPLKSLADLDREDHDAYMRVFTPAVQRSFDKVWREAIRSTEVQFMQVNPAFSRPTESMIAANPDFWRVKEQPVVASKTMKKGKKSQPVEPAAMKEEKKY